jgi:molybdopterin-guanine dinucleotide biosynthesis protein A
MSDIVGLVLAGGKSSRMGKDKAGVKLGGKTLLELAVARLSPQVGDIAVSANTAVQTSAPVLPDPIAGHAGPLAGILAGLEWAGTLKPLPTQVAFFPVDAPFFPENLVAKLKAESDGKKIIAVRSNGHVHPVFSLWPLSLAPLLHIHFAAGGTRKVYDFIETQPHHFVDIDFTGDADPFMNINTPDELAAAQSKAGNALSENA